MSLGVVQRFLNDPEHGQAPLSIQYVAEPPDVPFDDESVLLRPPTQDVERELERMPLQLHGHQVGYDAIQRVVAAIQIVLNAQGDLRRVLLSERRFGQGGEMELDGGEALLDVIVQLAGDPPALGLGRQDPRRRHPAKRFAPSEPANDADDHKFAPQARRRAEADFDGEPDAVPADGLKLHAEAHRTRRGTAAVRRPVTAVSVPKRRGDQHLHRFADHFVAGPPEHDLGPEVRLPDDAVAAHQENRVRRGLEDRLEVASARERADGSRLRMETLGHGAPPPGAGAEPLRCRHHSEGRRGA